MAIIPRTLEEKYYAINAAIIAYLTSVGITCAFHKYGVDAATVNEFGYPYFQSFYMNVRQNAYSKEASGIFTTFDYQLSFFTAPDTEFTKDTKEFYPFNVAKNAMSDVDLKILDGIAALQGITAEMDFNFKSGQPVPSAFVVYKMQAVCKYEAIIPPSTISTDIDSGISVTG